MAFSMYLRFSALNNLSLVLAILITMHLDIVAWVYFPKSVHRAPC